MSMRSKMFFPAGVFLLFGLMSVSMSPAARAGETPAHPNVEPVEKVRPANAYMIGHEDVKDFPKYEKLWKEIFQIR